MRFQFRKIGVDIEDSFYRGRDAGDFSWVAVRITLADQETDTFAELKVPVAMTVNGDQTLDALRQDALATTVEMLNAAASALQASSYSELVAAHTQMDQQGE